MTKREDRSANGSRFERRGVLAYSMAVLLGTTMIATTTTASYAQSVDLSKWSPDYVKSIAGTKDFDTAADCSKVTPLDYKGRLTYWYTGPNNASPDLDKKIDADFWAAWKAAYPNIQTDYQNIDYNVLLDKLRTSLLGNSGPMVVRLQIVGGVEFASKGYFQELKPEDIGYSSADFWPGAIKSDMWDGKEYGVPTNNETMAFIWNADIFKRAGLDPDKAPATWDDVVKDSKIIHDKLGIPGYGLVAKQNAGNTPFRFMPELWAYGSGALDEAAATPQYKDVWINNAGGKAALQTLVDMYVRDKSVPVSALTNTQNENQQPFIAGQLAMEIGHPAELAKMKDMASKATGADKDVADTVVANMRYGLIPAGPDGKRAVVFGGSNMHFIQPQYVDGGFDAPAAKAFACFWNSPEWSTKQAWNGSNPGNLQGFRTKWMKERLDTIKYLEVTTSMLPSGVPFPVIPQATEITNNVIPDMMQNALTGKMTVDQAADDAAKKIQDLMSGM